MSVYLYKCLNNLESHSLAFLKNADIHHTILAKIGACKQMLEYQAIDLGQLSVIF
jgi:uncharacterized CHY-type Zn-finger protein